MQISRKSDYALRAMVYVAAWEDNKVCSINEIAEAEQVPREYLAKILKELSLQGFLHSYKGIHGGYRLAKNRDKVTFLSIIEAMQGKIAVNDCIRHSNPDGCGRKPGCAMHAFWKAEQERVTKSLGSVSLDSLDYAEFYPHARSTGKKQAVKSA
ncbi:MAG: Rrf2 family transcriptional regulator [candidate division Zixibacteria bacterium]